MSTDQQVQACFSDDAVLGSLFAQEATGIAVTTLGGRFLRVNRALCRMTGYTEAELLEKTFQEITHPEDVESNENFRQRLRSGETANYTLDKRYLRKDGNVISVQVVVTVVRDGSGSPQCCATLVHNMTANMQAREAMQASETRFRRMAEMSSDWYWVQDAQFRFVELPGFEKMNFSMEDTLGRTRWELPQLGPLPEKAWAQHRAKLERCEPFYDFVFLRRNKLGELRYMSISGEPFYDGEGRFSGYRGTGKDVTERVRAQKALEDSEARYRTLFEMNPHPMWVVDSRTLAFLAVNEAAVRHYGYSREEFLSMSADQIRPPEEVSQLVQAFQDQSRSYRQRVWRHVKKNGELIYVEIDSFNVEFAKRAARLGVVTDITELVRAEELARGAKGNRRVLPKRKRCA